MRIACTSLQQLNHSCQRPHVAIETMRISCTSLQQLNHSYQRPNVLSVGICQNKQVGKSKSPVATRKVSFDNLIQASKIQLSQLCIFLVWRGIATCFSSLTFSFLFPLSVSASPHIFFFQKLLMNVVSLSMEHVHTAVTYSQYYLLAKTFRNHHLSSLNALEAGREMDAGDMNCLPPWGELSCGDDLLVRHEKLGQKLLRSIFKSLGVAKPDDVYS